MDSAVADSLQGSTAVYERHGADSVDGSNVVGDSLQGSIAV